MTDTHVAGVCGSLGDESATRVALQAALDGAVAAGATVDLVDLRHLELPVFDPDADEPPGATRLRDTLMAADAIILATPTYHGSYSSALKSALDHSGFDEFEHKTVGLVAVGGGRFPIPPLNHLREVCGSLDAWVLPRQVAIPRASSKVADGRLTDEELLDKLHALGADATAFAGVGRDRRSMPASENVGAE